MPQPVYLGMRRTTMVCVLAAALAACGGEPFEAGSVALWLPAVDGGDAGDVPLEAGGADSGPAEGGAPGTDAGDGAPLDGAEAAADGGDARDAGEDAPPVTCAGAAGPATFYAAMVTSYPLPPGVLLSCAVEPSPAIVAMDGYSCGPVLSGWSCPTGTTAQACRDASSSPPAAVVTVYCAP